ncbi:hypothetical protein GEMRC1_006823 [Eukaryota sp. GEM-RC1]
MSLSPEDRGNKVEELVGSIEEQHFHKDAIPNRLIPWVSPQDNSVGISDYDMWHLAKFAPWHPVIRNRMPKRRHYLLRNVPPGISPQVIERFLGDLYDGDAGDTYRYPSDYSWDPRHGILIEPLEPSFDADGRYVTYAYSAWYCQSLSNQVKTYHNVAVSSRHLPLFLMKVLWLSNSSGIGGSQKVLPVAHGALREVGTLLPKPEELRQTARLSAHVPGEPFRPESVDRFTNGSRDILSTRKFDGEFGDVDRFVASEEHENVYRVTENFTRDLNQESTVMSKKELEEPKIRHRNELIAEANKTKAERDRQSNKFPDLSPSIENHIDLSQSSEDERPDNVLHDSVILSSGVTPPKKIKKKKDREPFLKNDTRYEVVKFIHVMSENKLNVSIMTSGLVLL